ESLRAAVSRKVGATLHGDRAPDGAGVAGGGNPGRTLSQQRDRAAEVRDRVAGGLGRADHDDVHLAAADGGGGAYPGVGDTHADRGDPVDGAVDTRARAIV